MAFRPTEEQQAAIDIRSTALVAAAAGSGKTAVLTNRVIERMTDETGPVYADRLLVVTFTNAAAAEMRSRIENLLSERISADPKNQLLHRQQLLLNSASITTIDAFCIDLIRENFDRLGISPDFRIASAELIESLSDAVLTDILGRFFSENTNDFNELCAALGCDYDEDKLRDAILKICEYSSSMPFPEKWRADCVKDYENDDSFGKWGGAICFGIKADMKNLGIMLKEARASFAFSEALSAAYGEVIDYGIDLAIRIAAAADNKDWDEMRRLAATKLFPRAGRISAADDDQIERLKDSFKIIRKRADDAFDKILKILPTGLDEQKIIMKRAGRMVEMLCRLCDEYDSALFAALKARNLMSFADSEHLALRLLINEQDGSVTETDCAAEIRSRFDEILVDEYQDTNKLQDSLFHALSNGNNLFMVGDVKQSIYRFRHADPDGFLEKKNTYNTNLDDLSTPSKIILGRNFRSREGVCDFINFCFKYLMNEETAKMDYSDEDRLIAGATFPENDEIATDIAYIKYNDADDDRICAEARYIAQYINDAVNGKIKLSDRERKGLRAPGYGDFAILLRSFGNCAETYVNILRSNGIPVSANVGSLLSCPEVSVIMSLLKVLSNPMRDIPLISALRSPIFGFTDDELAQMRIDSPDTPLYTALIKYGETSDKAASFLEKTDYFRGQAAINSIDKFILLLLEETDYINIVLSMPDGGRKRRNLLMLSELAASYSAEEPLTLAAFISRIERADAAGSIKSAPPEGESDSVKIMSIHASKGLQFPVCILANCAGRLNKSDTTQSLVVSEEYGIGMRLRDEEQNRNISTAAREAVSLAVSRDSVAEELRLLYVALTRAEEKLLLTICEKEPEKRRASAAAGLSCNDSGDPFILPSAVLSAASYADWITLAAALHPAGGQYLGNERTVAGEKTGYLNVYSCDAPADEVNAAETIDGMTEPDEDAEKRLKERFSYKYPYLALNSVAAKTGVSRLVEQRSDTDYSFSALPSFCSKSGLTSAERGTLTHKFMQYADFDEAERSVADEINRLCELKFFTPDEAKGIFSDKVENFFKSELYKRMKLSPQVMREVRFIDEIPACRFIDGLPDEVKNDPVVVQGIADCIFEENGSLVIVDYKTDRADNLAQLAERYGEQLQIYAAAAEKNFGKPVAECVIYSFGLNGQISV